MYRVIFRGDNEKIANSLNAISKIYSNLGYFENSQNFGWFLIFRDEIKSF